MKQITYMGVILYMVDGTIKSCNMLKQELSVEQSMTILGFCDNYSLNLHPFSEEEV